MYTQINFQTKKALREYFLSGKDVWCYQPGPFEGTRTGSVCLEGPHFPKPHRWYASAQIEDCRIVKLEGKLVKILT